MIKYFIMAALFMISCGAEKTSLTSETLLSEGWKVQTSAVAGDNGVIISSEGLNTAEWYDAFVPSTIMGTLTANGLYQDLLVGANYTDASRKPFDVSWWYRTQFKRPDTVAGQNVQLQFDGISYRANIWLNGELIISKEECYGVFIRRSFDITNLLQDNNTLAVEVFRAREGEPNIGFVDWNPRPLDENMGIFREVRLLVTGSVEMKDTWVRSEVNTETFAEAWLYIETTLVNHSPSEVRGRLVGTIEGRNFSAPVTIPAGESITVRLTPDRHKQLHIKNPRLWWCNNMGAPELYNLDLRIITDNKISARNEIDFGIRQIESYFNEQGHRGFILNGQKVLITSAGWTDDIFLRDTPTTNEIQARYVKDMNLNSIRFENIWGTSQNIYDLCDKYGLLALVGWSCQWEWEYYIGTPDDEFGSIRSEEDMELLARSLRDQVLWLRNHPSIFAWMMGSDKLPRPELETKYLSFFSQIDDRIYLGAAAMRMSELSGSTGMKMEGPYEYVAPNYWFIDTKFGGAYGFNTETGPGSVVPFEESVLKTVLAENLFPVNEVWDFHCTPSTSAFNSMEVTTKTIEGRYGKAENLKQYLDRAHLLSYESVKSMFEAFRVNKDNLATGVVQWMLNSAWPSMYWQIYDFFLAPTSAYYGTKKANEPLQLIYNYADDYIYAANSTLNRVEGLRAAAQGYSTASKEFYRTEKEFSIEANSVVKLFKVDNSADNTLLFLTLANKKGDEVANNFYLLAPHYEVYDWDNTSWIGSPILTYADYRKVAAMPEAKLDVRIVEHTSERIVIEIENLSANIALFTHLLPLDTRDEIVYPVFWDDNFITLMPHQKRTLVCNFTEKELPAIIEKIKISGWNSEVQKYLLNFNL